LISADRKLLVLRGEKCRLAGHDYTVRFRVGW
jgi:hypothetical protein